MENAKIIERLRNVLSNLRRTAVKIHSPERRAEFADSEVRDGEALLDALAKSIELAPSATQAPPVPDGTIASLTRRLCELERRRDLVASDLFDLAQRLDRLETAVMDLQVAAGK